MGEATFGQTRVIVRKGDITQESVDAIVNAANPSLSGGGGVDGAIHAAGGPEILAACKVIRERQGGCPTGQAVVTTAGQLPARKVIHTVGPIWGAHGSPEECDQLLAAAYENCLRQAIANGLRTVAFPSISTGAYNFPLRRAAGVALRAVRAFLVQNPGMEEVRFVLFHKEALDAYRDALHATQ